MGGGVPTSIGSLTPFSHNKMSAVLSITNSEAATTSTHIAERVVAQAEDKRV